MPEPTATAPAEPEINDALPANAEVVAEDSEQISQLLARFGMSPELTEEPKTPAGEKEGEGAVAPAAGAPASGPAQPAGEAVQAPTAAIVAPKPGEGGFTPEQEAIIAARVEARAREFEPLTAERDAALAQVEELTARLQGITNPAPIPREIDPLLLEDDLNAIAKQERDAEQVLAWCDEHEDAGYTPEKEGEKAWTTTEIRKLRRTVEKQLQQTLPFARQLVQTRASKRADARKVYPALFDPKSEDYKIRQGFYQKAPWIKAVFPQFDLWLGDMIAGEKLRQKTGASTPPNVERSTLNVQRSENPPKPPTPPVLPSPGGAPLAPGGSGKPKVAGIDTDEFIKRGATRGALIDLIRTSGL